MRVLAGSFVFRTSIRFPGLPVGLDIHVSGGNRAKLDFPG